ncbi:NUDIX hydrolase [Algoriphagus terrigena]|uniref:NUDIX hydrolase n=1 Tax=Algoriphagus terrigena TaxID=344884 RepID=UPI0004081C77|nr:CoA pyrophosphatase [Algoriphagus terrigena]
MEFDQLIGLLERRLKAPLPGKVAHLKMSPQPVDQRRFEPILPANVRNSGVLILLYTDGKSTFFPLIKRPVYLGFHSGQMAFPGGKMEKTDENVIQTALREAEEEVGIDRHEVRLLGKLTDLYIPTSNFLVSPVVGFLEGIPEFIPDENEVSRIVETDLDFLLSPEIRKQTVLELGENIRLDTPYFEIDGEVVWGATAMILNELIQVLEHQEG